MFDSWKTRKKKNGKKISNPLTHSFLFLFQFFVLKCKRAFKNISRLDPIELSSLVIKCSHLKQIWTGFQGYVRSCNKLQNQLNELSNEWPKHIQNRIYIF